jgi:hypothetical protein
VPSRRGAPLTPRPARRSRRGSCAARPCGARAGAGRPRRAPRPPPGRPGPPAGSRAPGPGRAARRGRG